MIVSSRFKSVLLLLLLAVLVSGCTPARTLLIRPKAPFEKGIEVRRTYGWNASWRRISRRWSSMRGAAV